MAGDRHGFAGYCYDELPGTPLHCLNSEHPHPGPHSHWPTDTTWPNEAPGKPAPKQSLRGQRV